MCICIFYKKTSNWSIVFITTTKGIAADIDKYIKILRKVYSFSEIHVKQGNKLEEVLTECEIISMEVKSMIKKNVDIKHPNDHHLQILFNCLARISPSIHCSADNGMSFKEWATFDIKICKKKTSVSGTRTVCQPTIKNRPYFYAILNLQKLPLLST